MFGQNAFTGAINIVTKSALESSGVLTYQQDHTGKLMQSLPLDHPIAGIITHYTRKTAEGYRFNTDFTNEQIFLKGRFNKDKTPIEFF